MGLSPLERLERLRQGLKNSGGGGGDKTYYAFWKMNVGQHAILRFLPDKNENNIYPWAEKLYYQWKFPDPDKAGEELKVRLPCRETWDGKKTCDVANELRALFNTKDPADDKLARSYWFKRSFLYQGFVRKNPLSEQDVPENPIRLYAINKQIHGRIRDTLLETDPALAKFKHAGPDDYVNGRDFVVKKTQGPMYVDWGPSDWANDISPLTDDEMAAIEKYGLNDLTEKLGLRPSNEALALVPKIFEAHLGGKPWDKSWELHFKPQREKGDGAAAEADDGDAADSGDGPKSTKPAGASALKSDVMARIRGGASAAKATTPAATPAKAEPPKEEAPEPQKVDEAAAPKAAAAPAAGGSALERLRAAREAAAAAKAG